MMPSIEGVRCKVSATYRFCYENLTVISFVPENSICCREASAVKDVRYKKFSMY